MIVDNEHKRTEANTYLVDINSWTLFAIVDQLANIQSVLSQFFESMSQRLRNVNRNKVSHQSYREKKVKAKLENVLREVNLSFKAHIYS